MDEDCELWIDSEGQLKKEEQAYGSWICAPSFVKGRSPVIKVPGFYEARKKEKQRMSREEPIPSPVVVLGSQQAPVVVQTWNEERVVVQEEWCDSDIGAGTKATFTLETVGKSRDLGDGFEERIEEIDRGLKLFDRSESLNSGNEKDRMLGDEISSEHATKSLAFGQNGQPEKVTTQGVQLGPKGELLSNILNTLESDVTTMEFEPKGELLSNNFNTSNAFINEPLVYTVELINGLADLGGHAHASMPMQNVVCTVDNAVNNVGLPSPLPSNTKNLPLSDITNQATKQPQNGPKKKWSKLEREVDENNVSTDMEVQGSRRLEFELSEQPVQKKKRVSVVGGFYNENAQVDASRQHHRLQ